MNGVPGDSGNVGLRDARCGLARWMTVVFVLLTAAIALVWAHEKLMTQDEMYAFQTDSVGSLAELVRVQRTWPISLDPLLMHALSHGAMRVFGVGAFALRLPALAGFLAMQVCLFFLVREMAGERAGAVAAGFPALTATLYYATEGRPYGLMLGLYGLAALCWLKAARLEPTTQTRDVGHPVSGWGWALVGLAVALAATINAHYFGVLLLIPICAAEGYRTWARRRMDWRMWGAIGVGMLGFLGARPFLGAAGEFKKHYYNGGAVGLHDVTRAYRSIFVDYTKMSVTVQHAAMAGLVGFAVVLAWGCWRVGWSKPTSQRRGPSAGSGQVVGHPMVSGAEWVMVLTLAALPFCGVLLARFVTHSIEVRYVLGAVVGIAAMAGIAAGPWLRRDGVFAAVMVVLGLGIAGTGVVRVRDERRATAERMASLQLPDAVRRALGASADGRLYVQDMGIFEEERYYEPDVEVRARMTLVYSTAEELRWDRHDTMALTAMHLREFTDLPVVEYEELRQRAGEHVFVLQHSGWDWTDEAFAEDGAQVTPLAKVMTGDAAVVRIR